MNLHLLPNAVRVEHPFPVEQLVAVDGRTIRVALDWATIGHFVGPNTFDEQSVREFLRQHRTRIELAIKAHLFAQGIPLDGRLALSLGDLQSFLSV